MTLLQQALFLVVATLTAVGAQHRHGHPFRHPFRHPFGHPYGPPPSYIASAVTGGDLSYGSISSALTHHSVGPSYPPPTQSNDPGSFGTNNTNEYESNADPVSSSTNNTDKDGSNSNSGSSGTNNTDTHEDGWSPPGDPLDDPLTSKLDHVLWLRKVHGFMAAVPFIFLFPIGSIVLRFFRPHPRALQLHKCTHMLGYIMYLSALGMGHFINDRKDALTDGDDSLRHNCHGIIGTVVAVLLIMQVLLAFICRRHGDFRFQNPRPQHHIWSYLHMIPGHFVISLGVLNGGVGLWEAEGSDSAMLKMYIVVGVPAALWLLITKVIVGCFSRWRR